MSKIAVVTGSNKGIGFAIVKGLAKQFSGIIYLTARNEQLGKAAVEELKTKHNVSVSFHQLDIDNLESINNFAKFIKEKHGGLDILVNNAAIAFKAADTTPFAVQARETIRINFTGTLNVCNALFPLLRPHARVVNVSSRAGLLRVLKDENLKKKVNNPNTTVEDVVSVMNEFVEAAQNGTHERIATTAYGMSKVGLTGLTKVHQRLFDKDPRADIIINALCPGYVDTDMSSHKGPLTPDQGAETPIYLALLPENYDGPKGEFWADKKLFDWSDTKWTF